MVFQRLKEVHLKLNLNKCCFGVQNITFLGHVVSIEGSYLNPKKIIVVENFPILRTITNVRDFLGFTGYQHKFILRYAKIAKPLFGLTEKYCKVVWTPICQSAILTLKRCLARFITTIYFGHRLVYKGGWSHPIIEF
jgi:hypothetical protein